VEELIEEVEPQRHRGHREENTEDEIANCEMQIAKCKLNSP
jgi:hypothetical protein